MVICQRQADGSTTERSSLRVWQIVPLPVCPLINNMGLQVMISAMAGMRFQNVTENHTCK
jgi:hypothetical protein